MSAVTPRRAALLLSLVAVVACADDRPVAVDGALPLDATSDASGAAPCFSGTPRTRLEFLNRCTDAEFSTKTVALPLLRPDGGLPPLP